MSAPVTSLRNEARPIRGSRPETKTLRRPGECILSMLIQWINSCRRRLPAAWAVMPVLCSFAKADAMRKNDSHQVQAGNSRPSCVPHSARKRALAHKMKALVGKAVMELPEVSEC